jgi:hypothetical protein
MTSEQVEEMKKIYDEAIKKLEALTVEKQDIIKGYIKELEDQKMKAVRESLGLEANTQ